MLKHLPPPPLGTTRIVEPFAGSLAYSLAYGLPTTAADANPLMRELWNWLRTEATIDGLTELEGKVPAERVSVFSLGLKSPEATLMRLFISGAYVGQLSSKILYGDQHRFDLSKLKAALPSIQKNLSEVMADYSDCEATCSEPGVMAIVDPPYLSNTGANYKSKGKDHGSLDPQALLAFIKRLPCPTMVTYGDEAATTFQDLPWQVACIKKVPILRGGGTRERTEHYCLLNWST